MIESLITVLMMLKFYIFSYLKLRYRHLAGAHFPFYIVSGCINKEICSIGWPSQFHWTCLQRPRPSNRKAIEILKALCF
ncbi:hypothetical protein DMR_18690 [Solidesulfovibrio magneticus RS-1]|uniref:Uncharacterized protein n=1 Tax=Solidesulfovibrio magneticus (strain ATCC 700980 / DSM 13731 / RS-1) TaxID=573370 RepID=C4XQJ5_SOLM1|nr:hypothetical protein DMR_18690 [Solidesulfovibrio magneticus RS-1]